MSFKYASHRHWWYAIQASHGTTYVVLTLSLLIRPVWPSTYDELVSLRLKKNKQNVLLRYDCFAELNNAVQAYLQSTPVSPVYTKLTLSGVQLLDQGGLGLVVQVTPTHRDARNALKFGNLVCLSARGDFRDPLWAVVVAVEAGKSPAPAVSLELCSQHNSIQDADAIELLLHSTGAVMIESPTYYRAYEPVMRALQSLGEGEMPFADLVVQAEFARLNDGPDPGFITPSTTVDLSTFLKAQQVRQSGLDLASCAMDTASECSAAPDRPTVHRPPQSFSGVAPLALDPRTPTKEFGEGVRRYTLLADPQSVDYRELREYNMAHAQLMRLAGSGAMRHLITRIEVYDNPPLRETFEAESARMAARGVPVDETWVVHGTAAGNVEAIMTQGFKVGGEGIPIAHGAAHGNQGPDIPVGYGQGQVVILARALRGQRTAGRSPSADSWSAGSDVIIFRKGAQLLPVYAVHLRPDAARARAGLMQNRVGLVGGYSEGPVPVGAAVGLIHRVSEMPEETRRKWTDLDKGQLQSVGVALRNRIAVIQGPPGTGKTFIGVRILQCFLSMSTFPPSRPILVLTYKNHALDDFLLSCTKALGPGSVVRVGGRSTAAALEGRNLAALRRSTSRPQIVWDALKQAQGEADARKEELREALGALGAAARPGLGVEDVVLVGTAVQLERLLLDCPWPSHRGGAASAAPARQSDVSALMQQVPPGVRLQEFLQADPADEGQEALQSELLSVLREALALWTPAPAVFQRLVPVCVEPPLECLMDLGPAGAVGAPAPADAAVQGREVDLEEAERERKAAEGGPQWRAEDFVRLARPPHGARAGAEDVSGVCREAVAARLRQFPRLWELQDLQRAALVCLWRGAVRHSRGAAVEAALGPFAEARRAVQEVLCTEDAEIMRGHKVVGMTITGAAMRRAVLEQVLCHHVSMRVPHVRRGATAHPLCAFVCVCVCLCAPVSPHPPMRNTVVLRQWVRKRRLTRGWLGKTVLRTRGNGSRYTGARGASFWARFPTMTCCPHTGAPEMAGVM